MVVNKQELESDQCAEKAPTSKQNEMNECVRIREQRNNNEYQTNKSYSSGAFFLG